MPAPAPDSTIRPAMPFKGAALVLAIGLALTLALWHKAVTHLAAQTEERFRAHTEFVEKGIGERLTDYQTLLLSTQGFFLASEEVNRGEFHRYYENLQLKKRLPGFRAFSFTRLVPNSGRAAYVSRVRRDTHLDPAGFPDFDIHPPGERTEYWVIDYIEPFAETRSAFGLDAGTQPANRELPQARDSNTVTLTPPFQLVETPPGQSHLILRAPVYRNGAPIDSVERRRAAFLGFVGIVMRSGKLFSEFLEVDFLQGLRTVIRDGDSVILDSHPGGAAHVPGSARPSRSLRMRFADRDWDIEFIAEDAWLARVPDQMTPWLILAAGSAISLLLAILYFVLARGRATALQLAGDMNRDPRWSEERFRDLTELSADWYWEQDAQFRFTHMSVGVLNKSGITSVSTLGKTRWELPIEGVDEDGWAAHRALLERHEPFHDFNYIMRSPERGLRWFSISGRPIFDAEGRFCGYRGTGRDITERVHSETRLREQAGLLHAVFDHINQGISVVDGQLRMLGCNRRFLELLGFPEEYGAEGTTFETFVRYNAERGEYGPGDIEELVRARIALARRFEPHRFKRVRPDGTMIEIVGTPLPGGGMVTTYTDITEQEKAESALRSQTTLLQTTLENLEQGISVTDADLCMTAMNRRYCELLCFPLEMAYKGAPLEDFFRYNALRGEYGPGNAEEQVRSRMALARRFEPHQFKRTRPNGTILEIRGTPLPGGGFVTSYTDITGREHAENALRESEARFRRIIEQSPLSMAIVAMDGTIEFINRKAIETFGYLPEDIPDMQRWWTLAYPDDDYRREVVARWMALVEKAIAENREIAPGQYRVTCKDGGVKIMEIFGVPVSDKVFVMFDDVTAREAAAARVLRERDFRQRIIESIPGVFYLFDAEGRYLLWNRNLEIVTGRSAQEIESLHPLDLFEGEDRRLIEQRIGTVFATGSGTADARMLGKDGGKRPFHFTGQLITLEDGRPGLVGVGIDMTERQQAEDALARQTAVLQATLEAMDQGISVVDKDLRMTALNRRFCELLEFPEDLARSGASFADFCRFNAERGEYGPCDVDAKVAEMVERARHVVPHSFRRRRPNGLIVEVRGNPLPGGGFVTTYTDVTAQEMAQGALRSSEARFRSIFEKALTGIAFADMSGTLQDANDSLSKLLGFSRDELQGMNIAAFTHPEDLAVEARYLEQMEQGQRDYYRMDKRYITRSGQAVWVDLLVKLIRDDAGRPIHVVGMVADISERKLAEKAIQDLNETLEQRVRERTAELEASNRELESFSYSVSHDLRAPLRALHGFSHLLGEEYAHALDDNGQHYLSRIRAASERMGLLIDDLLDLARITRQDLKRVPVNLSRIAEEVKESLAEQSPERKAAWRIAPGLQAHADPVLAKVLLENLLRNAWKFTAEREQADIEFEAAVQDGETVYRVRDNGAGFDMAYADKLFQPFQRLHDAKRFEGTGIGLAIVHRVVRRHGGRIWAEGAPGQGASFYFTLP